MIGDRAEHRWPDRPRFTPYPDDPDLSYAEKHASATGFAVLCVELDREEERQRRVEAGESLLQVVS